MINYFQPVLSTPLQNRKLLKGYGHLQSHFGVKPYQRESLSRLLYKYGYENRFNDAIPSRNNLNAPNSVSRTESLPYDLLFGESTLKSKAS